MLNNLNQIPKIKKDTLKIDKKPRLVLLRRGRELPYLSSPNNSVLFFFKTKAANLNYKVKWLSLFKLFLSIFNVIFLILPTTNDCNSGRSGERSEIFILHLKMNVYWKGTYI